MQTPSSQAVEAARYALLRRIAPAMRHHLVANLQPIGMVYELLDRRLKSAAPNMAQVHEGAGKINRLAKASLVSSLDVITWLAPQDEATCTLAEGTAGVMELLSSNFSFRGFTVRNEVAEPSTTVNKNALRYALTAALMALSDSTPSPAAFVLSAAADAPVLTLRVERQAQGGSIAVNETAYRALPWEEVEVLARADSVSLLRGGDIVSFTFATASAAA